MLHGTINEQGHCLDVRYNISKINEYFSHVFLNWIERKKVNTVMKQIRIRITTTQKMLT